MKIYHFKINSPSKKGQILGQMMFNYFRLGFQQAELDGLLRPYKFIPTDNNKNLLSVEKVIKETEKLIDFYKGDL